MLQGFSQRVVPLALWVLLAAAAVAERTIESGRYADSAAAQAVWKPLAGTEAVAAAAAGESSSLLFPCRFRTSRPERAGWDRKVDLDLSRSRGVEFEFCCADPGPIAHLSMYFRSGAGWYVEAFRPGASNVWRTVRIDRSGMETEGKPAGWDSITAIRICAWRDGETDTEFRLRDLRTAGSLGDDVRVAIVRGGPAPGRSREDAAEAEVYAAAVADVFDEAGIPTLSIAEAEAKASLLRRAGLVVLPYNPSMPDRAAGEIADYLRGGGRLLAFYVLPDLLCPLVGIRAGTHVKAKQPGQFSTIQFDEGAVPGAPSAACQESWNIVDVRPVDGAARVLARWADDEGRSTDYPAVVGSSNGLLMTHVLLPGDAANKRRMVTAMAGFLEPRVWQQAAESALENAGRLGGYRGFREAVEAIGNGSSNALADVASARRLHEETESLIAAGLYLEACSKADEVGRLLKLGYCRAQTPLRGEFRAFWCHSAFGVNGMDWESAVRNLADNGFTAILPNMLWGGAAYYDSSVLPVVPAVRKNGDPLAECLAACRRHGLQMHVWKVNWNLGACAPRNLVGDLRRAKRLQEDAAGKEEPWLCPSHPENQKMEIDAMVEVARKYAVDGLHFDYIRYPDSAHCFCAGCKERFEKALAVRVGRFPDDVRSGPLKTQWLQWRRDNITTVVRAVSEQARAVRPGLKISAAVFSDWSTVRDTLGQDWKLWCEKGYLDFVCPMDYVPEDDHFESLVAKQTAWAGGVPCYPGIGASSSRSQLPPERVIDQIRITRRYATKGFVIFNYGVNEARNLVPCLGMGITAK